MLSLLVHIYILAPLLPGPGEALRGLCHPAAVTCMGAHSWLLSGPKGASGLSRLDTAHPVLVLGNAGGRGVLCPAELEVSVGGAVRDWSLPHSFFCWNLIEHRLRGSLDHWYLQLIQLVQSHPQQLCSSAQTC